MYESAQTTENIWWATGTICNINSKYKLVHIYWLNYCRQIYLHMILSSMLMFKWKKNEKKTTNKLNRSFESSSNCWFPSKAFFVHFVLIFLLKLLFIVSTFFSIHRSFQPKHFKIIRLLKRIFWHTGENLFETVAQDNEYILI